MQIRLGNKKLVMFIANADDMLEDDLVRLLKGKNPSWTIKDCEEVAVFLRRLGFQVFEVIKQTITREIDTKESQQKIQQEFDQCKMKLEALAKRKDIRF